MSQGSKKKRRFTLQIGFLTVACASLFACASVGNNQTQPIHPTVAENAKSLRYIKTIDKIGLGSDDAIKQIIAGDEFYELTRPVAIDIRDDVMIIADAGYVSTDRGTTVGEPNQAIAKAGIRVTSSGLGIIFKYNLKTNRMHPLFGAGDKIKGEITDIYLAKDKSFYVTDVEGRRVLHFSPEGSLLTEYKHPPNIFRPIAVTVDETRNEVIIADETYSHLVSFDMKKAEPIYGMGGRGEGPGKFRIITDMIAIPDGFLVSDRIELRIQVLDREGQYVADFGRSELMFPTALAVDRDGRVFVGEKSDNTIKVFKAGKLIEVIGRNGSAGGEFRYVSDMKVLGNQLYVVDSLNGRIQVFEFLPEKNVALAN